MARGSFHRRPTSNGMNILVFCSAQAVPEKYQQSTAKLGALIARGGHTLVWGGSDRGLMHTLGDSVRKGGGRLIGISMEILKHKIRADIDEAVIAKDLSERKKFMLERSDALIVLPGGIGTLDEATEVLALKRHGLHAKPVVFLDADHFYEGFRDQIAKMQEEGFFNDVDGDVVAGSAIIFFADTPEDAMRYIESYGN